MEYPNLLYKRGGAHPMKGGSYCYRAVNSDDERDVLLADGWACSVGELEDGGKPAVVVIEPVAPVDEFAPPTRAELEEKAKALGLAYHHKTGDKKLAELIEKALANGVE